MYGINKEIKEYIDIKIDKNKSFLKNFTFYNEEYKLISMFDSDMNANLSPGRYFAEVNNRVNTLFKYARELDLYPAFITITAPGAYHFKSDNYNGSTCRETALYLSKLWHKFLQLRIIRDIKKNSGHNMIYIRVYEPHKSGVPHLHAMIFVPKQFVKQVKIKFFEHFTKYEINKQSLKFITNFSHAKYEESKGAIAYILKYMNKTFKHAKDNIMTNEAYYFAYHGIRRFITSQTLVPLWLYRKVKHNEDSRCLLTLTKDYKKGLIYTSFDKEYITQKYIKKDIVLEDKEVISCDISVEEKVIYQKNHFISEQFKTNQIKYDSVPTTWTKKVNNIPIYQDGKIISIYRNGTYIPYKQHITDMNDFELYVYYKSYDVENDSYTYYLALINLMISKKLLTGTKHDLNNFCIKRFFS